jgi:hypothetical protein
MIVSVGLFFPPVGILYLYCATSWTVASYGVMSYQVATHFGQERMRFTLRTLMGVITWFAAYFAAWRTAVVLMLQQYSELPVTPPSDCYVSTAAAKGHRRFVRGEPVSARSGEMRRVNDQMRYLKAAELLLRASSPRGHRVLRSIYDRVGPVLAATLVHPALADTAYLALKPAEWLARAVLALLVPGQGALIRSLYGRAQGRQEDIMGIGAKGGPSHT